MDIGCSGIMFDDTGNGHMQSADQSASRYAEIRYAYHQVIDISSLPTGARTSQWTGPHSTDCVAIFGYCQIFEIELFSFNLSVVSMLEIRNLYKLAPIRIAQNRSNFVWLNFNKSTAIGLLSFDMDDSNRAEKDEPDEKPEIVSNVPMPYLLL